MSIAIYTDHDGTASLGDIGEDYLCGLLGMNRTGFIEAVHAMRERAARDPTYRATIRESMNCDYDDGLELAIMLVQQRVMRKCVEECGREAHNSIREGFFEYLESSPDEINILSAGPADWLRPFWEKYSDKIRVYGTELYTGRRGEYGGATLPCGKSGKPKIIIPSRNLVCVGDSEGDSGMFDHVWKNRGLVIAIGGDVQGDLNIPEYASWGPVYAAIEIYAELLGERQAAPPRFDPDEVAPNTDLGGRIAGLLRKRDSIKPSLTTASV